MAYIGTEGDYVAIEASVRDAMLFTIGGLQAGEVHLELGSGNGQFVTAALAAGADSTGWEINEERYLSSQSIDNIVHGDVLTNDLRTNQVRNANLITFWFTEPQGTFDLMTKMYRYMSAGARLCIVYKSRREWKGTVEQVINRNWNIDTVFWEPTSTWVDDHLVHLFVR